MEQGKRNLLKQIVFIFLAISITLTIFSGSAWYWSSLQREESALLSEDDFEEVVLVIDSAYIKPLYNLPRFISNTPESLSEIVRYKDNLFWNRADTFAKAEITIVPKNNNKHFRFPEVSHTAYYFNRLLELNASLKSGDSLYVLCKKVDLGVSERPFFLPEYYYRYDRPLAYHVTRNGKKIADIGQDVSIYIDQKIHDELFLYGVLISTVIMFGLIGYKLKIIKD